MFKPGSHLCFFAHDIGMHVSLTMPEQITHRPLIDVLIIAPATYKLVWWRSIMLTILQEC